MDETSAPPLPGLGYANDGTTIGTSSKYWKNIFTRQFTLNGYTVNQINNDHDTYLDFVESEVPTAGADARLITEGGFIRFFFDNLAFNTGDNIQLGPPEDSTYNDGAFVRSATISQDNFDTNSDLRIEDKLDKIDENINIAQAIDMLNEAMNNIRNNTFIRSVDFTAVPTALGSGQVVTLNLDVDGTWNRVEVDWDVGRRFAELEAQIPGYTRPAESHDYVRTGNNLSSVSFTYDAPLGGLFSVKVVVRNTNAQSPGSAGTDAEEVKTDYVTVYTPDPVADYELFRTLSVGSGTALSGNDFYVVEGSSLYLENFTTNTAGLFPNEATYEINWGDGTTNDLVGTLDVDGITILVNGDPLAGGGGKEVLDGNGNPVGTDAPRLEHAYPDGSQTGTGSTPVTLTLTAHNTADPAVIAAGVSITKNLKVYENDPLDPDRIDTKTLEFAGTSINGSTGTSPYLCAGATIITPNQVTFSGQSVNRTTKTSGDIESTINSTFAYGDVGLESDYANQVPELSAVVNGLLDGTLVHTNPAAIATGRDTSIQITSTDDYNLLNTDGSSTSFSTSIFYPDAFKGFKAKVVRSSASTSIGLNSFYIQHQAFTGVYSTNEIEFVKDDLTSVASLSGGAIIAGTNGTFRYISGIPYYSTDNPTVILTGVTISNFTGQTYRNTSQVLRVYSGANFEGTSASVVPTQYYNYSEINPAGTPFLTGGIPNANIGFNPTAFVPIDDIEINLTTSSTRTVDTIKYDIDNVNGRSASETRSETAINFHKSTQYGISEIAIDVSSSLGNGVYTDDGVRIFDFAAFGSQDTPPYSSTGTNFYSNNPYTESSDPGVEGTQEATVRLGNIEHNIVDYSSGFLPVGPNRTNDTGQQWFTFAFRRQVVANFSINIATDTGASNKGIAGMWVAFPGTGIDGASSLNGWLDCSIQYKGNGVPGANTGNGGNGTNGTAITGADAVPLNQDISGSFSMTLGEENMSNATNNVCLVRIRLDTGQRVTSLSIGTA